MKSPILKKTSVGLTMASLLFVSGICFQSSAEEDKPVKTSFPATMDHSAWDALLKKYVDRKGLVDYAGWKASETDRVELDNYLALYAPEPSVAATGNDLGATATNAYNAFAIRYILQNYPLESIQAKDHPFSEKIHEVGGKKVSLNDIEKGNAIPAIGWKAHGIFVCCARSCPPLQRDAYTGESLDEQVDEVYRKWLAREDLNTYMPDEGKVKISEIFKWYKDDFTDFGGVKKLLGVYGPKVHENFLVSGDYQVMYKDYNWGLNDQGDHGKNYGLGSELLDDVKNLFR